MKSMKIEDNKNVFPYKSLINLPYPEGVDASKREVKINELIEFLY